MSFVMIEGKRCSHVIEKVHPYKKNLTTPLHLTTWTIFSGNNLK